MPRSREIGQQRQSPRVPLNLKTTSSSESNSIQRPIREEHRRSPRSPLPECNQKKRGTRVADLETRLGHAQEELRKLKEQLASAEAAKRYAVQELQETKKQIDSIEDIKPLETDEPRVEEQPAVDAEKPDEKPQEVKDEDGRVEEEMVIISEPIESDPQENDKLVSEQGDDLSLKKRLVEAEAKQDELSQKLTSREEELQQSRAEANQLREQMESLTKVKEELEAEMKKLKVQTEQWRKAADAAAAIISGEDGSGFESGRRVAERCKHLVGIEGETKGDGLAGLPEVEDRVGGARRRSGTGGGAGIRMLGELWKRKGTQHK